jgi:Ca2+-transporting ATPase
MSVSLAVAAVPEGLPAVVTVTLALGLQRMVKRNALVRKLPSVETLGTVTVICSDKTGTLTRNEMTVRQIWTFSGTWSVTGAGYQPQGAFLRGNERSGEQDQGNVSRCDESGGNVTCQEDLEVGSDLTTALAIAAFCNNAQVMPHPTLSGTWQLIGDPTEGALLVAAMKAGIEPSVMRGQLMFEIPFDSDRKMMSVIVREKSGKIRLMTKGAPEVVVAHCSTILHAGKSHAMTDAHRESIVLASRQFAKRAMRVLALAQRELLDGDEALVKEEESLTFVGLVGMIDPPRDEVKEAVNRCHAAGIRPVMITGDHPDTAWAIARELLIADEDSQVMTGQELNATSDAELAANVGQIAVFARVTAEHKLRVVRAWQARGQVVAMTGDGVNDAPAVKAADIGIVMGITGTDVTKEAADMVLTDDNFTSIVNAVEEGRGIFDNIQKFLHFLLSSNASEVLFMFVAAIIGWPAPLIPIQLLWINLVTDSLPALALAMEPPEWDVMQRRPRKAREPVITWSRGRQILFHGSLIAIATLAAFHWTYDGSEASLHVARTVAFSVLTFSQIFYSLGCRSQRFTMPQLGLLSNPHLFAAIALSSVLQVTVLSFSFLHPVFGIVSIRPWNWFLIFVLSLIPVTIIEVIKLARLGGRRRPSPLSQAVSVPPSR